MQDDLIERNVETLKQVERLLAGGAYYADDDECHPLYPAAVAARQFLAARIAALEADNARLMGLVSSYRLQIDQLHDRAKIKETPDA